MIAFLEGPDLIVVFVILLLLFGGAKLPKLARSLGEAKRELDHGMNNVPATLMAATPAPEAAPVAPVVAAPVAAPVVVVAEPAHQPVADTAA